MKSFQTIQMMDFMWTWFVELSVTYVALLIWTVHYFTIILHHVIIYWIYILFNFTGKEYLMD